MQKQAPAAATICRCSTVLTTISWRTGEVIATGWLPSALSTRVLPPKMKRAILRKPADDASCAITLIIVCPLLVSQEGKQDRNRRRVNAAGLRTNATCVIHLHRPLDLHLCHKHGCVPPQHSQEKVHTCQTHTFIVPSTSTSATSMGAYRLSSACWPMPSLYLLRSAAVLCVLNVCVCVVCVVWCVCSQARGGCAPLQLRVLAHAQLHLLRSMAVLYDK